LLINQKPAIFFNLISKLLEREKQEEERVSAVCLSLNRISRYKILILSLLFFFFKKNGAFYLSILFLSVCSLCFCLNVVRGLFLLLC
jgi:hypothetical protein